MHHITEDTPPDMLAGAMDLAIRLPDGRDVHMSIERSTPMMDLLVQVTTAHKLRPSEHIIQALAMTCPQDRGERVLPYKPNTPLGALDTQCIRVLAKGTRAPAPKPPAPPGHQPFETTFRLQVHLPRNQFCVIRVGKHVLLEDIMRKVCEEKNLDPRKYEFRHPANIDKVLDPKRTLNDYEITEITVVHRGSGTLSSGDIMSLQREEERRKMQKTAGGVLNLIFRRGRTSMGSGSVSSDTRSISPTQSDDSRSVTPPAVQPPQLLPPQPLPVQEQKPAARPKPPQRKRRPAPKPPTQQPAAPPAPATAQDDAHPELEQCQPDVSAKLENGLTICHSRNSSDSSGYHEASILSDNCNTTLPRRPKSTVIHHTNNHNTNNNSSTLSGSIADLSKSTGNLAKMIGQSKSTMSLTNAGRKKKAPPPPPVLKAASSVANISTVTSSAPVVASRSRVEPPPAPDVSSLTNLTIPQPKPRTVKPQVPVPLPRQQLPTETNGPADDTTASNRTCVNQSDNPTKSEQDDPTPNLQRKSKFDTVGRKRGFQIGKSMLSLDDATVPSATSSLHNDQMSDSSSTKTRSSSSSNQYTEQVDNLDNIDNIEMFGHEHEKNGRKQSGNETMFLRVGSNVEIHGLAESASYKEISAAESEADMTSNVSMLSLRSVDSIPGFLGSAINIKKWDNVHELDEISFCSEDRGPAWTVGDGSDTESTYLPTPNETKTQPRTSDISPRTASPNSDLNTVQPGAQSVPATAAAVAQTRNTPEQQTTAVEHQTLELVTATPKQQQVEQPERIETISIPETRNLNVVESVKMVEYSSDNLVKEEKLNKLKHAMEETAEISQNLTKNKLELKSSQEPVITNVNLEIEPQLPAIAHQGTDPVVPQEQPVKELDSPAGLPTLNSLTITPRMDKNSYLEDHNELDSDWQYTLPSPPRAFRDSSPTNFTDLTNYDTVTFNNLSADSVVTSPQLFEKLESIRDTQSVSVESVQDTKSETDTIVSGVDNLSGQKSQLLTSKYLSLENLEKRKSLVLERELASLKNDENMETCLRNQKNNLITEIEEAIQNKTKSATLSRSNSQSREKLLLTATDSALPNFKITTYDQPKAKINIFEDDSVRSNVETKMAEPAKRNFIADANVSHRTNEDFTLLKKRHSLVSASTENIYFAKRNSADEFLFKRPQDPVRFRHASVTAATATVNGSQVDRFGEMVARSESFSSHKNGWSRLNPVKRSKSHISLDKYKDEGKVSVQEAEEGLHKSNSLFNVSGLQSLEVMRMILPKLGNTPPSSPTESKEEPLKTPPPKPQPESEPAVTEPVPAAPTVVKKYHYGGPPAINLGTWSDRPKSQVSLKEDRDYKISNIATMKAKFSSQTNLNTTSNSTDTFAKPKSPEATANFPTFNIRVNANESTDQPDGKINIKVNAEPPKIISNQNSNVIIKIGNGNEHAEDTVPLRNENKLKDNHFYSRFLNQTTAVGYRKPLGNINGVDKVKARPHSIAFDASCPDLSRVPIVRAVELKKPYKDSQGNRTITQIIHDTPELPNGNGEFAPAKVSPAKSNTLNNQYRHSSVYLSSENMNNAATTFKPSVYFSKPVTRGNSFAAARSNNTPVVKGFRTNGVDMEPVSSRGSWNQYGTLPAKSTTQNSVPMFSQSMLKRTDHGFLDKTERTDTRSSRQMVPVNGTEVHCPPPPPQIPKITSVVAKNPGLHQRQMQEEPRDVLLESIRNFGGKAGLKTAK